MCVCVVCVFQFVDLDMNSVGAETMRRIQRNHGTVLMAAHLANGATYFLRYERTN